MINYLIITGHIDGAINIKDKVNFSSFEHIICADKGLQYCDKFSVFPSLIVGDFDSVDVNYIKRYSDKGCNIIKFPKEKDMTDTELAVRAALFPSSLAKLHSKDIISDFPFKEHINITVLGGLGKRFDHAFGNIALLEKYSSYHKDIKLSIVDGYNRIEILLPGEYHIKPSSEKYISFISLSEKAENLSLNGFLYETRNITLYRSSSLGISNEVNSDTATVTFSKGTLLMIRSND